MEGQLNVTPAELDLTGCLSLDSLQVKDTSGNVVITDISLDIKPGHFIGVAGETGSGKSVLLKSCLTLLPDGLLAERGRLTVDREDIPIGGKKHRKLLGRVLGFVPQDPLLSLNPVRKVYSQAKELAKMRPGSNYQEVVEAMSKAGLEDPDSVLYKYPHELSGGLRQRVLIGLALLQRPKYIFCDEATTALDVIVQRAIMQTLRYTVDNSGVGLIFVSHDIALISEFADEILVMYGGHIVESGPVQDILYRPKHHYTKALINAQPKLEVGFIPNPIFGNVPTPGHRPAGCVYSPRCDHRQPKCDTSKPPLETKGEQSYACWFPSKLT